MATADSQPSASPTPSLPAPTVASGSTNEFASLVQWRNVAALGVVAIGVFLIVFFVLKPSANTTAGGPQIGSRAPDFSAKDTASQVVSLSALRGHAVLINFWFTGCPPCRTEMPDLQRAYDDLRNQGVVILGVDAIGEDAPTITAFTNPLGITYPLLLDADQHVTTELYDVNSTPSSFFIDRQGVIRGKHVGPLTVSDIRDGLSKL